MNGQRNSLAEAERETTIIVTINGKEVQLPGQMTVSAYLASRDLKDRLIVVELNGMILNRSEFASVLLSAGDQIEIVHFVGGG
jgi:sulfur carrier protein